MKVTIVGCGNMGLVYARAFLRYNIVTPFELLLVEKNVARKEELRMLNIGEVVVPTDALVSESELMILAVKPQDFPALAPQLQPMLRPGMTILSIMAGIRIPVIEQLLNHTNIVRAMPNSPVEVGMGITGFSAHPQVSPERIRKVESLLGTTGRTVFFEDENMLDAVTALSGSGPAYFFYIVKSMIEAGKRMGMEDAVAATLVKQTMFGAFQLINNGSKSLDELIQAVASKGGTTEAAFNVFNERQMGDALIDGILRAEARASELSQG